ncbi:uncharacterized protein LOC131854992 [Achroia grisella]|uniref:uncharacterized protein LOC131854992 n=1 Tax=Achroia grisella TaxID=688607 RepID=UPI0027D2EBF7|nr:uncharacterized protein LOC131854992 [Achroia grisella]
MASDHESTNHNSLLKGWTKREKFILLQSLKMHSSRKLEEISLNFPNKTVEDVKTAIDYYKEKALNHPTLPIKNKKPKKTPQFKSRIPLNLWAKVLSDSFNFKDLETETATALRIIAEFEKIPTSALTEDIDFRKVYHLLANALEGKSLQQDKNLVPLIEKCLFESAILSKSFIRKCTFRNILENINLHGQINMCPRLACINDIALVRHLASQKAYNPLNISEAHLKPSC